MYVKSQHPVLIIMHVHRRHTAPVEVITSPVSKTELWFPIWPRSSPAAFFHGLWIRSGMKFNSLRRRNSFPIVAFFTRSGVGCAPKWHLQVSSARLPDFLFALFRRNQGDISLAFGWEIRSFIYLLLFLFITR